MDIKVVQIGSHMPLSTRRVVVYFGKSTAVSTPIGRIAGMADGAVRLVVRRRGYNRDFDTRTQAVIGLVGIVTAP